MYTRKSLQHTNLKNLTKNLNRTEYFARLFTLTEKLKTREKNKNKK